ncbi:Ribosome assembly protein 1 [Elsinoe australis]|uniref:Ribosome assembly protein 1 n=1 Tax=Elsinoe australis TaxID=40998 RepID=A0A2P7YE35_9PEZI|nr:Ribosome assembly protein 1 [Elsinoe australis]
MANFDWHAERTDLSGMALLDRAPESEGIDLKEVRAAKTASFVAAGHDIDERERTWAKDMGELITELVGKDATVGLERLNANVGISLERLNANVGISTKKLGFKITDAQRLVEMARAIKSAEEVKCVVASLRATEVAVGKLRDAVRPGITENGLWSVLHQSVIEQNGDYCETRLLSAGQRTNPWFQETASYRIRESELVALDTDVVGCHGYYSDFSRTFHSGPDEPTAEQRELYKVA